MTCSLWLTLIIWFYEYGLFGRSKYCLRCVLCGFYFLNLFFIERVFFKICFESLTYIKCQLVLTWDGVYAPLECWLSNANLKLSPTITVYGVTIIYCTLWPLSDTEIIRQSNWHTNPHVNAGSTLHADEDRLPRSEILPPFSLQL